MSRVLELLELIDEMSDPETEDEYSLQGAKTGYRYQGRGASNMAKQYPDGKRPSGYKSKAGHSA